MILLAQPWNAQAALSAPVDSARLGQSPASDVVNTRDVDELRDRLDQWASHLGAFHPRNSWVSLGYGLPDNPMVGKHVLQDLEPYISTFPSMQCTGIFPNSNSLKQHCRQRHAADMSANQIQTAVGEFKSPVTKEIACRRPFCNDDWAQVDQEDGSVLPESVESVVGVNDFQKHIDHPFRQIALFSLPRFSKTWKQVRSVKIGEVADRDPLPASYRWPREDCGSEWGVGSKA